MKFEIGKNKHRVMQRTERETVEQFYCKPIVFIYMVNLDPRTPVIEVYNANYGGIIFYSNTHFMDYLKYHKISLDIFPPKFVQAVNTLCARPLYESNTYCRYSKIQFNLFFYFFVFALDTKTKNKKNEKIETRDVAV